MVADDDGESIGLFEPLLVSEGAKSRSKLNELAISLVEKSSALAASLPTPIAASLSDLVEVVDCYHSNLIEGHKTDPLDIDRVMRGDYSDDVETRDLQLEARAHIEVQQWISRQKNEATSFSFEFVREIHRRFCGGLPPSFLLVGTGEHDRTRVLEPGAIRTYRVQVGRHVAISPAAVPRFLARMEQAYKPQGRTERILAASCCHHRLLWVHPFLDGNGRVARLLASNAIRSETSTNLLWSLSRGLARRGKEYKAHLQSCDEPRRGSLDGRGTLSEGALAAFVEYVLETCLEEVTFMSDLMRPQELRDRLMKWALDEIRSGSLPPQADVVLGALITCGELDQAEVDALTDTRNGPAKQLSTALIESGVAQAKTLHSGLRLSFPVRLKDQLLPGIFLMDQAGQTIREI
ncbi:Fic family protein [Rhizobium sp. 2MFCol3.1]|uniref:Fic family protein n=1 Tax=Rhizobium sp. 2MFCol3.1 TaxID=1246459 RepID=UPI000DDE8AB9|nr:Fic family protein [Rhizobium sp. 2MFCol3.1]